MDAPQLSSQSLPQAEAAFNARAVFALSADRLYRVYVREGALYFIRIGGQGGLDAAVAGQFGLLGGLAMSLWQKRGKAKQEARIAAQDEQDAQDLLSAHKHNFRLYPEDVLESSIEPPASAATHGLHVGRWLLSLPDKKLSLQFERVEDMQLALLHLPRLLGSRLKVDVEWNEAKERYQKVANR